MKNLIAVYKLERKYKTLMKKINNTEDHHFIGKDDVDMDFVLDWNQMPGLRKRQKGLKRRLYNACIAIDGNDLDQLKEMSDQPSDLPSGIPVKRLLVSYYECERKWLTWGFQGAELSFNDWLLVKA